MAKQIKTNGSGGGGVLREMKFSQGSIKVNLLAIN